MWWTGRRFVVISSYTAREEEGHGCFEALPRVENLSYNNNNTAPERHPLWAQSTYPSPPPFFSLAPDLKQPQYAANQVEMSNGWLSTSSAWVWKNPAATSAEATITFWPTVHKHHHLHNRRAVYFLFHCLCGMGESFSSSPPSMARDDDDRFPLPRNISSSKTSNSARMKFSRLLCRTYVFHPSFRIADYESSSNLGFFFFIPLNLFHHAFSHIKYWRQIRQRNNNNGDCLFNAKTSRNLWVKRLLSVGFHLSLRSH